MAAAHQAFDPKKSAGKAKALLEFLQNGGFDDVTKVPSIGPSLSRTLAKKKPPINTVYQLMGRFLQFRFKDIKQEWWCQSFYEWLCDNGARSNFAQHITFCLAECLTVYLPDLFDQTKFTACTPGEAVPLPSFAKPKEGGATFHAKHSTARPEAIKALITNGSEFAYANDLSKVESLGFGPATLKKLKSRKITSLYQIYGVFLSLYSKKITQAEWTAECYQWCKNNGVSSGYCANVTDAVCQFLDVRFNGLYDRSAALAAPEGAAAASASASAV